MYHTESRSLGPIAIVSLFCVDAMFTVYVYSTLPPSPSVPVVVTVLRRH